jgi:predicted DsbA family dithiol-disulfide isomerase
MTIDIWSDVVCPFCYLGSRQLSIALEAFEHRDEVGVVLHAFELDPHSPVSLDLPLDELVAKKYDLPVEKARELHHRLEAQAHDLGMTWSLASAKPTNTFDAHRLIALSTSKGLGEAMSRRLFKAYFSEGLFLGDRLQLDELARDVGVTDSPTLWAGDDYSNEVRADEARAEELSITGVPAFLIDNKFMVLGAQGAEQIVDVLRRAWARRAA